MRGAALAGARRSTVPVRHYFAGVNGTPQNLLEPFAFGAGLRMHPLVVLLITVLAGVFAGVARGRRGRRVVMAAPLTAIARDTARLLRREMPENRPPQADSKSPAAASDADAGLGMLE